MLIKMSLDQFIRHPEDGALAAPMMLSQFGEPLSRAEHYQLAKSIFPSSYVEAETGSTWQLIRAHDNGFSPCDYEDMLLTEKTLAGEYVYHWSYARKLITDELWAFEPGMLNG